MKISKLIKLYEESLISYLLDGIRNGNMNKAELYKTKTIKEIKYEITLYENIRSGKTNYKESKPTQGNESNSQKKCFKCNRKGQIAKDCKGEVV